MGEMRNGYNILVGKPEWKERNKWTRISKKQVEHGEPDSSG
jgi:hypothetical protein